GAVKCGTAGGGQAVHLLVGPAFLLKGPRLGQSLGQQPRERRVDRTEAGALEMRERAFLEGLLDLVAGGLFLEEDGEAQGLHVHRNRPAGDCTYRIDIYCIDIAVQRSRVSTPQKGSGGASVPRRRSYVF